ncbi:MAG: putative zinc-binding protein [Candidatus Delongbacteria bacterium]|nr:putative zinc-binding protein [Candidatus Delongbacteria bacterium]MDD4204651.1 putative zinc-binding protein [Candidatus Delongbacteria bacterium]
MAGCGCGCGGNEETRFVYSCSGGADLGEIADKVTRKLSKDGCLTTVCLAGLGADLSGFVESAKSADLNVTIDGCGVLCAKKTLERHGVKPLSFSMTELGLAKGKTPASDEIVNEIFKMIKEKVENRNAC